MKSWSIWKRRRATKTRPSSSCLASGEVGTGAVGPWRAQLTLKVKMPWAAAGSAVPGGGEGGIAKAQQPPSRGPTCCLSSLSPRRLIATVSGGTAQIWARFRLRVEVSACTACVSVCSAVCLLSYKGSQQNCCCSRNRCRVANWPSLWLGENRWAAKRKKSACLEINLQLPPQNR